VLILMALARLLIGRSVATTARGETARETAV
jgi:hypothetical protein